MKCSIMLHFIWVFTVCKSTYLGVSPIQRIKIDFKFFMTFLLGCLLYHLIGMAPITQYTHVCNNNRTTQGSSPNVVKVISIPQGTALKRNKPLPLGANSFL